MTRNTTVHFASPSLLHFCFCQYPCPLYVRLEDIIIYIFYVCLRYSFPLNNGDEITGCSEKACDYLSIGDARQMLLFSCDQELAAYIKEVNIMRGFWLSLPGILFSID
ncbi:hypothetical protein EUGRSUZ_E00694 [Eucalyptus grandis]|uniref:Uncharacterized protein n=2 Tax=Eucalyptus grandis TaxID=71139 RepID=A0ACC3KSC8_EUCGR|nr:hypothetical protein EUGRSUZ_E00694 [Eucalyptus grandis]